jgi:hypothetical protein
MVHSYHVACISLVFSSCKSLMIKMRLSSGSASIPFYASALKV